MVDAAESRASSVDNDASRDTPEIPVNNPDGDRDEDVRRYEQGFRGLRSAYGAYSSVFNSQVRWSGAALAVQLGLGLYLVAFSELTCAPTAFNLRRPQTLFSWTRSPTRSPNGRLLVEDPPTPRKASFVPGDKRQQQTVRYQVLLRFAKGPAVRTTYSVRKTGTPCFSLSRVALLWTRHSQAHCYESRRPPLSTRPRHGRAPSKHPHTLPATEPPSCRRSDLPASLSSARSPGNTRSGTFASAHGNAAETAAVAVVLHENRRGMHQNCRCCSSRRRKRKRKQMGRWESRSLRRAQTSETRQTSD